MHVHVLMDVKDEVRLYNERCFDFLVLAMQLAKSSLST